MYSPIVAMDVAAAKATEEPSEGRARQKERKEVAAGTYYKEEEEEE